MPILLYVPEVLAIFFASLSMSPSLSPSRQGRDQESRVPDHPTSGNLTFEKLHAERERVRLSLIVSLQVLDQHIGCDCRLIEAAIWVVDYIAYALVYVRYIVITT